MSEAATGNAVLSTMTAPSEEQRIQNLEIAVQRVYDHVVELRKTSKTIDVILAQLTNRILLLERQYFNLKNSVGAGNVQLGQLSPSGMDETLRRLASRVDDGKPSGTYFNTRFRDYETAIRNIKNLAAYRGASLSEERLSKNASGPRFIALKAKGCTETDIESDWVAFWCNELKIAPSYHRKVWELAYVPQILFNEGKLIEGSKGLGFACGEERLPSLFAKYGVSVLATDLDPSRAEAQGWIKSNQHLQGFKQLRRPDVCPDESRLATIEAKYVDMNTIPADFKGQFDFCWSICSLEHLGSIANGLNFIENSLDVLKPGGVSVHTMEFNVNDGETVDNWPTVLFQKQHLLQLADKLRKRGFDVYDLDFDKGRGILDGFVDLPPYSDESIYRSPHLKLSVDGFVCTSFSFVAKVPA